MHALLLTPFKRNRFNILFESSAAVFFLHNQITTYLQDNQIIKSVLHDIIKEEHLAGVKAFGLVSQLVTGQLWALLEDRSVFMY